MGILGLGGGFRGGQDLGFRRFKRGLVGSGVQELGGLKGLRGL